MSLSLLEILQRTEEFLRKSGIENPRLDAEWLLARALKCKRLDLYLQFDKPLNDEVLSQLREWVRRRSKREPLQYIEGAVEFLDLKIYTGRCALIPRPETEQLVEYLRAVAVDAGGSPRRILDLGTGTGVIALSLAQTLTDAVVVGVDFSEECLTLARENAAVNSLDRVEWIQSDWFESLGSRRFDWIVSNPPYLTEKEWSDAQPEVRDYEPRAALVAANEGLADLDRILNAAPGYLEDGGMVALETGIEHHDKLEEIAKSVGFGRTQSLKDIQGRARFFLAWA